MVFGTSGMEQLLCCTKISVETGADPRLQLFIVGSDSCTYPPSRFLVVARAAPPLLYEQVPSAPFVQLVLAHQW